MKQYVYVADPGHAWLVVPMIDIPKEVRDNISEYSYKNKSVAYLEEDTDAPLFISFLQRKGVRYKIKEADHLSEDHPCRKYARFTA
jgi:hypothetical protein